MIVGIDGNEANVEKRVGIGEYSFELLKQFEEFQIPNSKFQIYLKNRPIIDLPKERGGWTYRIVGPKPFWTQLALPLDLYIHKIRPDIFFSPTHYAPRFSPVPTVISVMDLSYIHYPEMFKRSDLYQLKSWTSYSIKKASKVLTISKASKDDIIKIYQIPEKKVVVTYPGIKLKTQMSKLKTTTQNLKLLREKYGVEGGYILFVGTLQPRKNIVRLIEAFARTRGPAETSSKFKVKSSKLEGNPSSRVTPRSLSLIIIGKKGWMWEEILNAPKRFGVEDSVKFLEFVSDEDLEAFYQDAVCFVLPSLYEGFGLPVLEAMKNGCPVITSNISSLPEAGGDAALYVDPEDVDDIASKINSLIRNKKLREELIKKGYNHVKKFSWEKTAEETLKVLETVVKNK